MVEECPGEDLTFAAQMLRVFGPDFQGQVILLRNLIVPQATALSDGEIQLTPVWGKKKK